MNETKNDVNLLGSKTNPQQDADADQNPAIEESITEPAAAASNNHDTPGGDQPGPVADSHRQQESGHDSATSGPRNAPLSKYWQSTVVPWLEQNLDERIKCPPILDRLMDMHPEDFESCKRESLLRSLQRHVKLFYQERGTVSQKSRSRTRRRNPVCRYGLMIPQEHPPGREVQVDFTDCKTLNVTIQSNPFPHKLFDARLSHSGWTHIEVYLGENLAALMGGLQHTFNELGGVPEVVRKDRHGSSTQYGKPVATFRDFLRNYNLEQSLINTRRPWENGGVERNNGWIKANLEQALLIRGNRDFETRKDYESFVQEVVNWGNRRPVVQQKLQQEAVYLRSLPASPSPEFSPARRTINTYGIINLYERAYSVPCKKRGPMPGAEVNVRLYAEHVEVYDENWGKLACYERLHEKKGVRIDYRHVTPYILLKPNSFAKMRETWKVQMFPKETFKQAHDKLKEWHAQDGGNHDVKSDVEYLLILHLAAKEGLEGDVEEALKRLLESGHSFGHKDVEREVRTPIHYGNTLVVSTPL